MPGTSGQGEWIQYPKKEDRRIVTAWNVMVEEPEAKKWSCISLCLRRGNRTKLAYGKKRGKSHDAKTTMSDSGDGSHSGFGGKNKWNIGQPKQTRNKIFSGAVWVCRHLRTEKARVLPNRYAPPLQGVRRGTYRPCVARQPLERVPTLS